MCTLSAVSASCCCSVFLAAAVEAAALRISIANAFWDTPRSTIQLERSCTHECRPRAAAPSRRQGDCVTWFVLAGGEVQMDLAMPS